MTTTHTIMVHWYIDNEAYQFDATFHVKKICILKNDCSQCFNYFVKNPDDLPHLPSTDTVRHQMRRHKLSWIFGDVTFASVLKQIIQKLGPTAPPVYIKGFEKFTFLRPHITNLRQMPESPSFDSMNNCMCEMCDAKHGKYCARRKVHELRYYDYNICGI